MWPTRVALRRAAEPAVGDQRDVLAESRAGDRRGDREHLRHPGRTLRSLVADHDDVAGHDRAARERVERVLSRNRTAARGRGTRALAAPAIFMTEPSGASEPRRIAVPPSGWIGAVERMHDRRRRAPRVADRGEVLGDRLARDRHAVAVQQPGLEQLLHARPARRRRGRGRSSRTCPAGRTSTRCGTLARDRDRSRRARASTPASRAIASRCSTAFVEPASAIIDRDRVLERLASSGCRAGADRSARAARPRATPVSRANDLASVVDGGRRRARPAATCRSPRRRAAIVFAVYIPAHEPVVGHACALDLDAARRRSSCPSRARRRPRTRPGS